MTGRLNALVLGLILLILTAVTQFCPPDSPPPVGAVPWGQRNSSQSVPLWRPWAPDRDVHGASEELLRFGVTSWRSLGPAPAGFMPVVASRCLSRKDISPIRGKSLAFAAREVRSNRPALALLMVSLQI